MKTFKTHQLVMLASDKESNLVLKDNGQLEFCTNKPIYGVNNLGWKYHNLYILSDEKPSIGDWSINLASPHKHMELCSIDNERELEAYVNKVSNDCRKVIATTDSSLFDEQDCPVRGSDSKFRYILPQIQQNFIEHFVKEYNKGNVIENVEVEYEDNGEEDWLGDDTNGEPFWNEKWELKIHSKDNTINIKPIEEKMYSREEVEQIVWEMHHKVFLFEATYEGTEKFIEQNL